MDHDVALVLAGGLVGLVSSVVALTMQRRWTLRDRRAASEREALDLAVRAILAWKDLALGILNKEWNTDAEKRLHELDLRWEADPRLIPDQEAAEELLRLCKEIRIGMYEEARGVETLDRVLYLANRVQESAQKRRQELA